MLNEADNMIDFPGMYSLDEMWEKANEIDDFLEELITKILQDQSEFEKISRLIRDLIDRYMSRSAVLRTFNVVSFITE